MVLVHDQFSARATSKDLKLNIKSSSPLFETKGPRFKSRRGSTASVNSGSITPRIPETSGLGIYSGEGIGRDFEGVGGWRFPGPDDEDGLWTSMNSRLELPSTSVERKRHHRRSFTSGSMSSAPLETSPPTLSRARTPNTAHIAGNATPEEYFVDRPPSRSTGALDTANIGRVLLRSKTSSISMFSLDGPSRAAQSRTSH